MTPLVNHPEHTDLDRETGCTLNAHCEYALGTKIQNQGGNQVQEATSGIHIQNPDRGKNGRQTPALNVTLQNSVENTVAGSAVS